LDTATALAWIGRIAQSVRAEADHLTQLDAAIGDADHGVNLQRGFTAVEKVLSEGTFETVGAVLTKTGTTLISTVGGASGPLYGSAFRAAGKQLTGATATPEEVLAALRAGLAAVQKLGAAQVGDKTMVDAFDPAITALDQALTGGADEHAAFRAAADASDEGARSTIPLIARKGRASYLGPRSEGHQDPGATSTALIFHALADSV
jgi:dihydroxyacetone kinase-like protein